MPTKRPFRPGDLLGFSGQPLALPSEAMPLSDRNRERFKAAGQESFLPYADPWRTLAGAQGYRQAETNLDIADAENQFVTELGEIAKSPTGFQAFLQKNPLATFSPLVKTYQAIHGTPKAMKDPYEDTVAKEGSHYLEAYRTAVASGQDPVQAFSQVRDAVKQQKATSQQTKDDELFFVEKGGDLEDFPTLKESGASRAAMLQHIRDKGKAPTAYDVKQHTKLSEDLRQAETALETEDTANRSPMADAYEAAKGEKPKTPDQWTEAYYLYKKNLLEPRQQALADFEAGLADQGKRVPGGKKASVPQTPTSPTNANQQPLRSVQPNGNYPLPTGLPQTQTIPTVPAVPLGNPQSPTSVPATTTPSGSQAPVTPLVPTVSPFDGGPIAPLPAAEVPPPVTKPGLSPLSQIRKVLKP